jgi:hypothetical protein
MSGVSRLTQENLITAALLVFFGGVIWLCQDFGPRARMIPQPLAISGIILTVIQIAWQNLRSTDELQMGLFASAERSLQREASRAGAPEKADRRPAWRQELAACGIVGLLIALILVTGIIPAVFLYTAGYFLLTRHYSLRASLFYTAILTTAIYLLFVVALQIQPYHGMLAPLVERFS